MNSSHSFVINHKKSANKNVYIYGIISVIIKLNIINVTKSNTA